MKSDYPFSSFRWWLVLLLFALTSALKAQTNGTWTNVAGGTWQTSTNWQGGVIASGTDAIADFSTLDITAARTVTLGSSFTVGTLKFADVTPTNNWALARTGTAVLTLATSTGAPTIEVDNETLTISAVLAGTQGFSKTGAGILNLTGANTLSGAINVSAGNLEFASGALGAGTITLATGTTLTWDAANLQDVSSQILISDGGTVTLTPGGTGILVLASALQTGPLGTGGVIKANAGTWELTGANTWTGGTTLNNGTTILTGGNNRLSASGTVALGATTNSAILQLGDATGASNQTVTGLTVSGGANSLADAVVGGSSAVSTLTVNWASGTDTYAGYLGGSGTNNNNLALTKTGAGTLDLNVAKAAGGSTFTGGVNINAGVLSFASGGIGTGSNLITFTGTSTLTWDAANTQDISSGGIVISDGVTATLNVGANNVTLATGLQGGTLGTGTLSKNGAGTLTLTGVSTYKGATRVITGTLVLTGGDNRLSTSSALQLGQGANSGILQLGDATGVSNQTAPSLAVVGTGTANAVVGGNSAISTLTINNSAADTYAQMLGGTGTNQNNLALTKTGAGVLTLSGANTFVGNVNINGGTLQIQSSGALGAGIKTVFITGATNAPSLKLNPTSGGVSLAAGINFDTSNDNATTPAILSSAGDNVIAGNITLDSGGFGTGQTRIVVGAGTLTLNGNIAPAATASSARTLILDGASNGTANGVLSDNSVSLGVTKQGAGTWTLTGANSYSGPTQVNVGTLNITTAQTGGGAMTVTDGAVLGLTLAAPGQTLNASSFTLGTTTGATLNLGLGTFPNPTAPLISAGTLTINGTDTINVSGTALSVGIFNLIGYTGSIGGSGFAGLTLGTLPARVTANLVNNTAGSTVQLDITAFDIPKWTGANGNVWDINDGPDPTTGSGTVNWKEANSGNATRYLQSGSTIDSVLFDDSANVGTTNINLINTATPYTPTSITVNNSVLTYEFSGAGQLGGATTILKEGTGLFILANTGGNDYTGTTTISAGTLQAGDGVTFGGGQLGTGAIIDNGTLALDRPLGDDYTLSNVLSGSGALVQEGGDTVVLSGNNSAFSGNITVTSGALRAGSPMALGSGAGLITVQSGAFLELTGQTLANNIQLSGTLQLFSGTTNQITGTVTLSGGGTVDGFNSTILTIPTAITGTGGLTKIDNGTLILTGANNYTGGTSIGGGLVQVGQAAGTSTTASLGTGAIDFSNASGTATLTILRADNGLNISDNITSSGAGTNAIILGITGATSPSGTVTFSGNNSFTGNVTITGGALDITNSNALGAGTKTISIANASQPALELDGSGGNITLAAGINYSISSGGTGTDAAATAGSIVNLAGNNVINGNISMINGGGGQGRLQVQGGTLTVNGNIDDTGATGVRTLLIGGAGNGTINGVISDASFVSSVTKDGTGTWTLTGSNAFTGAVTVQAGTLAVNSIAGLGTAQPLGAGTAAILLGTATTAGTLQYTGSSAATLSSPITVNGVGGGVVNNTGGALLTLGGTITNNGRTLTLQGGPINITGVVTGATLGTLNIAGVTVNLSNAANTFNATVNVYGGGTLQNGAAQALPSATGLVLGESVNNTAGTYDLNGFNDTLSTLNSAGTGASVITNNGASGFNTLTVSGAGTYGGVIRDGATAQTALTKSGSGVLNLTGASTFTGNTTVTGGTLDLASTASTTSSATINTGGTLVTSGTVQGNVTVQSGGKLYATENGSTGLVALNGSLTLNTGSNAFFDLGGTDRGATTNGYDSVNGLNALTLAGTINVSFINGFDPQAGAVFDLLDWTNLTPSNVNGTGLAFNFTSATLDAGLSWDTSNFLSNGTIAVVAGAAPEPSRVLLLVGGIAALLLRRRRVSPNL